jgi:hypothetical protein
VATAYGNQDDILVGSDAIRAIPSMVVKATTSWSPVLAMTASMAGWHGYRRAARQSCRLPSRSGGYSNNDKWFDFVVSERGVGVTKALHDMEYVQFADGIYQINQTTGELTPVPPTGCVIYSSSASLTDRDGSEVFDSLVLSGMPKGSESCKGSQLLGTVRDDGVSLHRVGQAVEQQCTGSEPERSDSAGTG